MKSPTLLDIGIITCALCILFPAGSLVCKNANTAVEPEENRYLDSVATQIDIWFDDLSLSWETILLNLDSLESVVLKDFTNRSLPVAYIIHKKGVVQYNLGLEGDQDAFNTAIELYEQAINIRQEFSAQNQEVIPDIINGINNVAANYLKLNDPFTAIEYLSQGLVQANNYRGEKSIVNTVLFMYNTAARSYEAVGDYDNALKYYEYTVNYSNPDQDSSLEARVEVWKIRAYNEMAGVQANYLNLPEQAIENLEKAQDLLESNHPNRKALLAEVYHNLGLSYQRLDQYQKAIDFYQKSSKINRELGNENILAGNYLNLGNIYNTLNQIDSASWYLNHAKNKYTSLEEFYNLSLVYDNLADIEFEKGNYLESIDLDNQSMTYLVSSYKPTSIYSNPTVDAKTIPDKEGLLVSLDSKATTLLHLFDETNDRSYLDHACQTFLLADELIGLMRSDFLADASKLFLGTRAKKVYEHAVSAFFRLYEITGNDSIFSQAFRLSENSRAVTLLDAVRKTEARNSVDRHLVHEERMLSLKVNFFEKQHALGNKEQTQGAISQTLDSLLLYRRKHDSVLNSIEIKFPSYYDLIFNQETVTPNIASEFLGKHQSLIEYFLGDSSLFTFLISPDTLLFLKTKQVDSVRLWSSGLNRGIHAQDQSFIDPANKLYEHLIYPLHSTGCLTPNLIIVPDDVLSLINFETLVTKIPDAGRVYFPSFKDYLLYSHQISYAFSATSMMESIEAQPAVGRKLLAIAPSFEHGFSIRGNFFDQLEWNTYEAEQVGKLFSGKSLIDGDANKQSFAELAPDFGLIHFATHAKADNVQGDLSFIVFGEDESELLYAKDLYALDINADVVVLSACQTSLGPVSKGEGIISLARGFIYAGASSVVTSLWNVRERTNNNIILEFYNGLKKGNTKDHALREAKISFLESVDSENQELAHPYFWSPLICIGNQDPIAGKSITPWIPLTFILILLAVLTYVFKSRYQPAA